jgi:predicted amidohydrolase
MRIHVLQIAYGDDEKVADRVARVAALVGRQEGADLVVLPELWAPTGFGYRDWDARAEPVDGPTVAAIAAQARAIGAVVHAGSIVERVLDGADPGPQGRGRWNTSVLIGPDGSVLARYRKIHRFGFGEGEPLLLEAGSEIVTSVLPGGVVAGLATCYDLRFPEMFRRLVDAGARLVLVPAAWAIEDQVVLVQCNTAGTHAGVTMGGRSQIVAATGEVLAAAGDGEQTLVVEVDPGDVDRWRANFPVLADRRL